MRRVCYWGCSQFLSLYAKTTQCAMTNRATLSSWSLWIPSTGSTCILHIFGVCNIYMGPVPLSLLGQELACNGLVLWLETVLNRSAALGNRFRSFLISHLEVNNFLADVEGLAGRMWKCGVFKNVLGKFLKEVTYNRIPAQILAFVKWQRGTE